MVDQPSDADRPTVEPPDRASPPGVPRWVKVFAVVAVALILLVLVAMVISGGGHGSGRHMSRGVSGSHPLAISTAASGAQTG